MLKEIKIAIADDHEVILEALIVLISKEEGFEIVGQAKNGEEIITVVDKVKPDLLILDLSMPVMNGGEAVKILKKKYPNLKILILSMIKKKSTISSLMQIGINGYILKENSSKELKNAISQIIEGNNYFGQEVLNALTQPDDHLSPTPEKLDLSRREIQILKEVSIGKTSKEIAEQLGISDRTVQVHRRNIMLKLNVPNERFLVRYAIKHGLIEA